MGGVLFDVSVEMKLTVRATHDLRLFSASCAFKALLNVEVFKAPENLHKRRAGPPVIQSCLHDPVGDV